MPDRNDVSAEAYNAAWLKMHAARVAERQRVNTPWPKTEDRNGNKE